MGSESGLTQAIFAGPGQNNPKKRCEGANRHHEEGLAGATRLPMGLYVPPWSPNNEPSLAKCDPAVIGSHTKIAICQLNHGSLIMAES